MACNFQGILHKKAVRESEKKFRYYAVKKSNPFYSKKKYYVITIITIII